MAINTLPIIIQIVNDMLSGSCVGSSVVNVVGIIVVVVVCTDVNTIVGAEVVGLGVGVVVVGFDAVVVGVVVVGVDAVVVGVAVVGVAVVVVVVGFDAVVVVDKIQSPSTVQDPDGIPLHGLPITIHVDNDGSNIAKQQIFVAGCVVGAEQSETVSHELPIIPPMHDSCVPHVGSS